MKKLVPFKMDEDQLKKAKYLAWYERTTLTGVITEDLTKRINKFEKEHGEITAAMIKKMEDTK